MGYYLPFIERYLLLHVWIAYFPDSSNLNSNVNRVSSPQGTLASTQISSRFSDKWAKRFLPTDLRFIWGLAAKWTFQNSASLGTFAVQVSLSADDPKKQLKRKGRKIYVIIGLLQQPLPALLLAITKPRQHIIFKF